MVNINNIIDNTHIPIKTLEYISKINDERNQLLNKISKYNNSSREANNRPLPTHLYKDYQRAEYLYNIILKILLKYEIDNGNDSWNSITQLTSSDFNHYNTQSVGRGKNRSIRRRRRRNNKIYRNKTYRLKY